MKYKLFLLVCINAVALCFPYNIIGCAGGDSDPYDYYVSFFAKNNSNVQGYTPFYYTDVQFLYEEKEPVTTSDVTAAEWTGYASNSFSKKEAIEFVTKYERKHLANLYYHLEKNQPLQHPGFHQEQWHDQLVHEEQRPGSTWLYHVCQAG